MLSTLLLSTALVAHGSPDPTLATLREGFRTPPADARVMMRWWWFGPAVTREGIEQELVTMKEGGLGGVEVQPVYPLAPDDVPGGLRNIPFLSKEFGEALRSASDKSHELGLRFDLTLGSGWPFGGPTVGIQDAAAGLRVERVKVVSGETRVVVPALGSGETLLASYLGPAHGDLPAPGGLRRLGAPADGAVLLAAAVSVPSEAVFFIASPTGMQVKRASIGGEGYVLDHYSRKALDRYLQSVGEPLLAATPGRPPHAIFCDSLEVYGADWASDLLSEFRARRGYDLADHLPALAFDGEVDATRVRQDWGLTMTELVEERFIKPLADWAHSRGTRLRAQAYGTPPARIATGALVDLPEGEGVHWKQVTATRWASSSAHIYGRPVTSSETWTWLHSPVFRASPLDLKAEADVHFLQGVNQLIGHGWPYTPAAVEYPGWRFYAAGVFNEKNPWWIAMPDVATYLQRVSHILRQGRPMADVAVYMPNADSYATFRKGHMHLLEKLRERVGEEVLARLVEAGYAFDFFDDETLRTVGRVERDSLVLGSGRYRMVLLPGVEAIPVDTYRTLVAFADAGGRLVPTRRLPDTAPGLLASEEDRAEVRRLSARLRAFETEGPELALALRRILPPAVDFGAPSIRLGFAHRQTNDADIYFLANTSNEKQVATVSLRSQRKAGEWWDAVTGTVTPAEIARVSGRATTRLTLAPYESRILVLSDLRPAPPPTVAAGPTIDISEDWSVRFGDAPAIPMATLRSWTDDDATRYFSGQATYRKKIVVSAGALHIDFGEGQALPVGGPRARFRAWYEGPVREAAVVRVNGQRAGAVWCPPYRLDLTPFLREGENDLEIVVGNLAVNHMAGRAQPDYKLLHLRYGKRFDPQDMDRIEPMPSGLIGRVRLIGGESGAADR